MLKDLSQLKDKTQNETTVRRIWLYEDATPYSLNYSTFFRGEPNNWNGIEECLTLSQPPWKAPDVWGVLDNRCWDLDRTPAEHLCAVPINSTIGGVPFWNGEYQPFKAWFYTK